MSLLIPIDSKDKRYEENIQNYKNNLKKSRSIQMIRMNYLWFSGIFRGCKNGTLEHKRLRQS